MALNFNTLLTRTLTAIIFVAVLMSAITYSYLSFGSLFLVISLWGLNEFYKISVKLGAKPFKLIGYAGGAVVFIASFFQNADLHLNFKVIYAEGFAILTLAFFAALFSKNENPFKDIAYTIAGVFYCVIPFVLLNHISCISEEIPCDLVYSYGSNYNPHLILGLFFLIWANDTYAYLVGSLIGKRKLYESVSPAKTWEGTVGAAILTISSSLVIANWFQELETMHWMVISFIVVVAGTLGDLTESMLKRQAGIKDSGRIMPGHGGILDRFDSLMFIAPFVYLFLTIVYS